MLRTYFSDGGAVLEDQSFAELDYFHFRLGHDSSIMDRCYWKLASNLGISHLCRTHLLNIMKLIYAILVLMLLFLASAQCQQTAKDWFIEGNRFTDQGKYNEAIAAYEEAIKLDPGNSSAWNNIGHVLNCQGKNDEAINYFDEAIKRDLNSTSAWNNKGHALFSQGKYDEAVKAYSEAIERDPSSVDAWNNKGIALCYLGKYDEAIECFDGAIRADPDHAASYSNKGYVLKGLDRQTEADAALAKAKELENNA